MSRRWWWLAIAVTTAVGLGLRLLPVLLTRHPPFGGDPTEYWQQSNLLAQGVGWVEPFRYYFLHQRLQTADLPPLYTLLLTPCSLLGVKSFFAHRVWSCLISATAIPLAGGLTRRLAGTAAGLTAAILTALYPNIWVAAPTGFSETATPVVILLVLGCASRARDRPTTGNVAVLGVMLGVAILSRTDEVLLAVLVMVPVALRRRSRTSMLRGGVVALAGLLLIVAPLAVYNSVRLHHPVFVTDEFGIALAQATTATTYSGPLAAYWYPPAQLTVPPNGSEAATSDQDEHLALTYIRAHTGQVPLLAAERLGRTFGLYRPHQQVELDIRFENRPRVAAWVGLVSYYVLALLAVPGAVILRRRRVRLLPMLAVLVDVVVSTVLTYGDTRFRTPLEPVIVVLASVTISKALPSLRPGAPPGAGDENRTRTVSLGS